MYRRGVGLFGRWGGKGYGGLKGRGVGVERVRGLGCVGG